MVSCAAILTPSSHDPGSQQGARCSYDNRIQNSTGAMRLVVAFGIWNVDRWAAGAKCLCEGCSCCLRHSSSDCGLQLPIMHKSLLLLLLLLVMMIRMISMKGKSPNNSASSCTTAAAAVLARP